MAAKTKSQRISTVTQIENLKPRDDRYEVADGKLTSNRLVVFPSGSKSWIFRYRFGGRTRKLTLDAGATDLARARKLGAEALNAVKAGIDPGTVRQEKKRAGSPITVDDLIKKYAEKHLGRSEDSKTGVISYSLRSGDEVERILRKELKPFSKRQAGGISELEAGKLIDEVAERGSVMANRTLVNCKALYKFAMSPKVKAASSNPFAAIEPLDEDSRERVLSNDELTAVWNAAGKLGGPYGEVVRLLILSAQRLSEIANLNWAELNFGKRQIVLPGARTKNERPHIVAMSDLALEILEKAKEKKVESEEGLVFTLSGERLNGWSKFRGRLYEAVEEALEKKPERWTLHDLRRSAATHMSEDLKIAPHVIDKILNHSTGAIRGVAAIYNRGELLDERCAALQAWGRHVDELVNGAPPPMLCR
jgi:integrase